MEPKSSFFKHNGSALNTRIHLSLQYSPLSLFAGYQSSLRYYVKYFVDIKHSTTMPSSKKPATMGAKPSLAVFESENSSLLLSLTHNSFIAASALLWSPYSTYSIVND